MNISSVGQACLLWINDLIVFYSKISLETKHHDGDTFTSASLEVSGYIVTPLQ